MNSSTFKKPMSTYDVRFRFVKLLFSRSDLLPGLPTDMREAAVELLLRDDIKSDAYNAELGTLYNEIVIWEKISSLARDMQDLEIPSVSGTLSHSRAAKITDRGDGVVGILRELGISMHFEKDIHHTLGEYESLNGKDSNDLRQRVLELMERSAVRAWVAATQQKDIVIKKTSSDIPKVAPELYAGNRGGATGGEDIVAFMRRVWMPWIGSLTLPDLRRLDARAAQGITNRKARGLPWPDDLFIPTKRELKAARDARIAADPDVEERLRAARSEARQIARAIGRRS